ncbi:MAG: choice-of-anchor K domain-containing protein [Chloroflexia bacterium]
MARPQRSRGCLTAGATRTHPLAAWVLAALLLFALCAGARIAPVAASGPLTVATQAQFANAFDPAVANPTSCGGPGQSTCTSGAPVQVRWGTPASGSGRSGLGFAPNVGVTPELGTPFQVGSLTHYNFPITGGTFASSVELTINVVVSEGATVLFNAPVHVQFTIDETPNSGTCPYPSTTPCSDAIHLNGAGGGPSAQTVLGNTAYTLQILGFKESASSTAAPLTQFISDEGGQRTGYLFAQLSAGSAVVAHAGPDQAAIEDSPVTLNGSTSQPAGITYAWTQIGGPTVMLSGADTATPTFTAPSVATDTPLTFRLTVTGDPYTDDDEVVVTVQALPTPATATDAGNASGSAGDSATLTATVTSPAGVVNEGTVEFTIKQGGATIGSPVTGGVVAGTATAPFSLAGVAVGSYDIQARYLPADEAAFSASADATPGTLSVTVPIAATSLSVAGSGSYGSPATLTATLTTAGQPLQGRKVQFALNGVAICDNAPGYATPCPVTGNDGVAVLANASTAGLEGSTAYPLTATYSGETGYRESTAISSLTLARIAQAITFPHPGNSTYGSMPLALAATSSSGLTIIYSTSSPCAITNDPSLKVNGAGSCVVEASQPGDNNYLPAAPVDVTVAIARVPLVLRANNDSIQFGAAVPCAVSPVAPTSFVNDDTVASLDGTLACATAPASINMLGNYQLRPSGLTSSNYTITYQNGTLAVTRCNTSLTLTLLPGSAVNYSDLITFRAQLTTCGGPIVPGTTVIPAGPVQFALDGATFGSKTFAANGVVEFQGPMLRNARPELAYSVTAVFTSNDTRFSGSAATPKALTVNPEDAAVSTSGPSTFAVNAVSKKGTVQLKATLSEVADSSAGDLRTARVRFSSTLPVGHQ